MPPAPKQEPPVDAATSTLALIVKNPWILLLLGFTGGGGVGTLLGRPVVSAPELSHEDVQAIVDASVEKNNAVLLQKIELLLAREKLHDAGLSSPALTPSAAP